MTPRLIFAGGLLEAIRARLLSEAPREGAAVLLAKHVTRSNAVRLLVDDAVFATPAEYDFQEEQHAQLSAAFIARVVRRARDNGLSAVLAHTHPFSSDPTFSAVDDEGERTLLPSIFARAPGPHGAIVLGQPGVSARLYITPGSESVEARVVDTGARVLTYAVGETQLGREFDRSVRALGSAGQQLLRQLAVAVVGVGGLGSIVAQQLSHLGVGRLILIDNDVLDHTNLNRVAGAKRKLIGRAKVDVISSYIADAGLSVAVEPIQGSFLDASVVERVLDCDFVFGCTDTHGSRAVLNQTAYQYLIPTIDAGVHITVSDEVIAGIAGRVQMLAPGLPCLVCLNLLDSDQVRRDLMTEQMRVADPYMPGSGEPQPAVMSINGTVASLAVTMFLSAAVGTPMVARYQNYDGVRGVVRAVQANPIPTCPVCSRQGTLSAGDALPAPGRPDAPA